MKKLYAVLIYISLFNSSCKAQVIVRNELKDGNATYNLAMDTSFVNTLPKVSEDLQYYPNNWITGDDGSINKKIISKILASHTAVDVKNTYYVTVYISGLGKVIALTLISKDRLSDSKALDIIKEIKETVNYTVRAKYKDEIYVGSLVYRIPSNDLKKEH